MIRIYPLIVLIVVVVLFVGCSSTPTHTGLDTKSLVRCDALFYVESNTFEPGKLQDELRSAALWFRAQYDTNDPTNRSLYKQTHTEQIRLYRSGVEHPNHGFVDGCLKYYLLYSGYVEDDEEDDRPYRDPIFDY